MNQDFLNTVDFKDNVKLPKGKIKEAPAQEGEIIPRHRTFRAKLYRLIGFILTIIVLVLVTKYGVESFICFCRGTSHETIGQMYHEIHPTPR